MQPRASTSHCPPTTVHRLRDLYIQLAKEIILNAIYQPGPHLTEGHEWPPGDAFTMIGRKRLDNLEQLTRIVLEEGIPGDLIETGVWRGGATILMRALLKAYGDRERTVWVADSFEGLPEPDANLFPKEAAVYHGPTVQRVYKKMAATLEEVRENFNSYGLLDKQVHFLKGWFKDTLPTASISQLALMRLDGDYYESTMDSLSNLYDKLSIGGIVIIDDYGEDLWTNCRQAVDQFREKRAIKDPMISVDSKC